MRTSLLMLVLVGLLVLGMSGGAFALQSGGVEIGDLDTGSVVGQPFKELDVDLTFTAMEVGGKNGWYPPTAILNLVTSGTGSRSGRPVLLQVNNSLSQDYSFFLSADSSFAGPTSLRVSVDLKPGETKYIGIPTSDLTYVTANRILQYKNPHAASDSSGQLLVLRK